jgi:hypothetical protein
MKTRFAMAVLSVLDRRRRPVIRRTRERAPTDHRPIDLYRGRGSNLLAIRQKI